MGRLLCIALSSLLLVGCSAPLRLPEDPLRMTVVQRHDEVIPGSDGRLRLELGDITHGQVVLAIRQKEGEPVLPLRSVKPGDVVPFKFGGREYYLSVIELRDFITDDFGVFDLSRKRPAVAQTQRASGRP